MCLHPIALHDKNARRRRRSHLTTLTISMLGEPLARIRTIKPDFFTSLTIGALSKQARLTFIGMWTHVDDEGRCVDDARLIKAAVWPLDDDVTVADVEADLQALATVECSDGTPGLIVRYAVGGRRYLAVRAWKEHQRIDKPTKSKLPARPDPAPDGPSGGETGVADDSRKAPGGLPEGSRLEGNREQGREGEQGEERTSVPAVGGPTVRNARANGTAPSAQPRRSPTVSSLTARSLIAEIPRYRDPMVKPWFRRQLIEMADVALAAGLGREAIVAYAGQVIAEGTYRQHQHIPEFRAALARLGRDVELGHACPACARDPEGAFCCVTPEQAERPWTAGDQAALERVLDQLGATVDELAREA